RYGGKRSERLQLTASEAALQNRSLNPETVRRIRVYFIKPSRYDDDGYVSVFRFGVLPNNTLTVLAALNSTLNQRYAAAQRNVYLETVIWDELCDGVISPETIKAIKDKAREDGVELLIGMSGVQSNQYPRGRDLALQFVAHGITTMMGGFHVSGYPDSVTFLNSCGITAIVGEAENLWGDIVEDFLRGELKPRYSVTEGIRAKTGQEDILVPMITDAQLPTLDDRYLTRFHNPTMTTLDTSRGCPFTCSYCSVKNVMGRTMRSREPDAVVAWVRDACRYHNIKSLFLVDDDFFRSPRWEEILTGLVQVKKEFPRLSFMMQVDVDASCYANIAEGETENAKHRRSRRFTELAAAAGCYQAFVGIESLNPDNLNFATKYQNTDDRQHKFKIEEARARVINKYRRVVENWHKVGVSVHAGYMLGFPFDGADCGRVAARMLRKIGFDIVSFFVMTPLPGTEDQVRYTKEGSIIDWDFNNLDSQHVTLKHEKMDTQGWLQAYRDA
ncbi:MAG TPA: radical SAM protein, partial [Candidatus Binataceae bacterium]|nr:radical SAM protein [Candidatus Binataceae bacterium]